MSCHYHPEREAVDMCSDCGQAVCQECNYVTGTHPICRHCWDLRVSNIKAGTHVKPLENKRPMKEMVTPHEQPSAEEHVTYEPPTDQKPEEAVQDTGAASQEPDTFSKTIPEEVLAIPVEPTEMQQPPEAETETPAYEPSEEMFTPYSPSTPGEPSVTHEPPIEQEPEEAVQDTQAVHQEPDTSTETPPQEVIALPEELAAQDTKPIEQEPEPADEAPPQDATAIPVEPTDQSPLLTHGANMLLQQPVVPQPQVEVTHVEPETTHVEPATGNVWATAEPTIAHEAKLDTGKQKRSVFGSLFRLKPRKDKPGTSHKKKPSKGQHHVQVSQQTFQCHQCGTENAIGELFCQACGSWFQYSCPTCGAIVDPGFDSCPSCSAELGWG